MPEDVSKTKMATLNPLYLKAVRDEADSPGKLAPPRQGGRTTASVPGGEPTVAGSGAEFPAPNERPVDHQVPAVPGPATELADTRAAILKKQAQIAHIRLELGKLRELREAAGSFDAQSHTTRLNELRLKRLAIQMAMVSGSREFDDGDLAALDREIAALVKSAPAARKGEGAADPNVRHLDAQVEGLQAQMKVLTSELKQLALEHNLNVVIRKAREYVDALKRANALRQDLVALASLSHGKGPLANLNLDGSFPNPRGIAAFAEVLPEDISITAEGVEMAKARMREELVLL